MSTEAKQLIIKQMGSITSWGILEVRRLDRRYAAAVAGSG